MSVYGLAWALGLHCSADKSPIVIYKQWSHEYGCKRLENVISDLGDIFKEKLQLLIILRVQRLEGTRRIKCVWHRSKHKS